jgi:dTMP kinase
MRGLFITFEGNEGSGKSTQIKLLAARLQKMGYRVHTLREPGGTPIGEEIRHTLKHSLNNQAMTPEAELLLMNASRAQLVREVIRPALDAGEIVLCDRFYDSTIAYQGHGRQLDLKMVEATVETAVGDTRPRLTLLLLVPEPISEQRRAARCATQPMIRDRMEEADRKFFARVAQGYEIIAKTEPSRVRKIDATRGVEQIEAEIWKIVRPLIEAMRLNRR